MPKGFRSALLNSASPWATTKEQLIDLYNSPYTGAVTVRTSLLNGWIHDDDVHRWTFFDARANITVPERSPNANSSFNTLGYSPIPLPEYLRIIEEIVQESATGPYKPFVLSVTGDPDDVVRIRRLIADSSDKTSIPLLMEVNLSCPNIIDLPPPAYSGASLQQYLFALQSDESAHNGVRSVPVGIKTSPYTYHDQFKTVIDSLAATVAEGMACPISFITATNTLGSSLLMNQAEGDSSWKAAFPSESGIGLGGVGGTAIHALSLGNVKTLRTMLDQNSSLRQIEIIGVGGVNDFFGFSRMKSAGASAVAIGTGFGREGIDIFHKITVELQGVANNIDGGT